MIPHPVAVRWVRDRAADTPRAAIRRHAAQMGLGPAEVDAILGNAPDTPPRTAPDAAAATGAARVPLCVHLGAAVGLQPGVPCGQRRRDCSEFGECSLVGPPGVGGHYCRDAHGAVACAEFEAKD